METIIITGAAGLVGRHAVQKFLEVGYRVIAITHGRSLDHNCLHVQTLDNLHQVSIDLRDSTEANAEANAERIADILNVTGSNASNIHFLNAASNTQMIRSVGFPLESWIDNCNIIAGVMHLVDKLKLLHSISIRKFIHVSSNAVYGDVLNKPHAEWDYILPSNAYAASKAAQEALVISYWRTRGLPLVICNTMCIIGVGERRDRFIPSTIVNLLLKKKPVIYIDKYGAPLRRTFIDVLDLVDGFLSIIDHHEPYGYENWSCGDKHGDRWACGMPSRFNLCGNVVSDIEGLVNTIARSLNLNIKDIGMQYIKVDERTFDYEYALDNSRAMWEFGFKVNNTLKDTIDRIVADYYANGFPLETT